MRRLSLQDGTAPFEVTVFEAAQPSRVVVFAVGGGGNPERHAPLLAALAQAGSAVVAPHFERLVSPIPSDTDLLLRARRLTLALDVVAQSGVPTIGVGHSIGATMLLALAGGQVWRRAGQPLAITPDGRIERLALMAPATGFFRVPGALSAVHTPLVVWAAQNDAITPLAQAVFLKEQLGQRVPVDLHVVPGAGHFSFMHVLPPQVSDPLADREAFLASLEAEIQAFVFK